MGPTFEAESFQEGTGGFADKAKKADTLPLSDE
jgi:hypothetical protein